VKKFKLVVDVSEAAALGEPAHIALTVCLPNIGKQGEPPVVCFAKPGAGFSRHYFTTDLPGPASGDQASWHVNNGWIFVAVDPLGVGESSQHDSLLLDFDVAIRTNLAAENTVIEKLCKGELYADLPPTKKPIKIGMGQSMGGCLTIIQQARHHCYDGIAILGFSAVHTQPKAPPGDPEIVTAWYTPSEDGNKRLLQNAKEFRQAYIDFHGCEPGPSALIANRKPAAEQWFYYHDDVAEHLPGSDTGPAWISKKLPGYVVFVLSPGIIAAEAAAVSSPVFIGLGERDVVADLELECNAFSSAQSINTLVCPSMGHMHNFAGTRERLWQGIQSWIEDLHTLNNSRDPLPQTDTHG